MDMRRTEPVFPHIVGEGSVMDDTADPMVKLPEIKAGEPTVKGHTYSAGVLKSLVADAQESIRGGHLSIYRGWGPQGHTIGTITALAFDGTHVHVGYYLLPDYADIRRITPCMAVELDRFVCTSAKLRCFVPWGNPDATEGEFGGVPAEIPKITRERLDDLQEAALEGKLRTGAPETFRCGVCKQEKRAWLIDRRRYDPNWSGPEVCTQCVNDGILWAARQAKQRTMDLVQDDYAHPPAPPAPPGAPPAVHPADAPTA